MHRIHRVLSLCAALLLIGCATAPKGLTPKPDVRPVQESVAKAQASIGKTREDVVRLKQSQEKASDALKRANDYLDKFTGASQAVSDARKELDVVRAETDQARKYTDWADTELANAWKYETDAGERISVLSGQIDVAHQNEATAVAYSLKAKPVIDQVNSYWGLGAFAYGFKILARHLLIVALVLGVGGALLFIFARPVITLVATWFTVVISWFRKK